MAVCGGCWWMVVVLITVHQWWWCALLSVCGGCWWMVVALVQACMWCWVLIIICGWCWWAVIVHLVAMLLTVTWHLDSQQWGARWLFTDLGGRKQPDSDDVTCHHHQMTHCCIVSTLPAFIWFVTWHCCIVVALWCAMVIVGGQQALWAVVVMGDHGDAALVGVMR